jgi:alkanesulfonate monooxygenase SsuD/methylene tetrahydromethanopterin reductase-like flavin-dependent oxidoreductase (luciferase family)
MKVGLVLGNLETMARDAKRAEEAGFDYAACGEHAFFHGPTSNAFVGLAAAAASTERIRLVSTVSLAAQYPAALFAKLAASLDVVSQGRLELGIGAGGEYPAEFQALGIALESRFQRIEEAIRVCKLLFSGNQVSFGGVYTRFSEIRLQPRPVQIPGPPIWLAGRREGGIRRAGRIADVWLPYMVTSEEFRSGLELIRQIEAENARPPRSVAGAIYAWTCCDNDGDWALRTGVTSVSAVYNQDFSPLADRYLFIGTPDKVVGRFREYASAGADRAVIAIAGRGNERQRIWDTLTADVLPALREL